MFLGKFLGLPHLKKNDFLITNKQKTKKFGKNSFSVRVSKHWQLHTKSSNPGSVWTQQRSYFEEIKHQYTTRGWISRCHQNSMFPGEPGFLVRKEVGEGVQGWLKSREAWFPFQKGVMRYRSPRPTLFRMIGQAPASTTWVATPLEWR
jgi:hypothetical protein